MKFIVLCFPRTASTLLITALGEHPAVRQGMEIFNPVLEGEAPYVTWRKRTMLELYGAHASYLDAAGYLDEARFDLTQLARRFFQDFDGTKIMYDQLALQSGVWDHLAAISDLGVIVLRRNIIEAAMSFRIAMETGTWHVLAGEAPPQPPRLTYDPDYFIWFYNHFCSREAQVLARFERHRVLAIDYPSLTGRWSETLLAAQSFLGLEPVVVSMPFRKGVSHSARTLIANYEEVRNRAAKHPVLARHVEGLEADPQNQTSGG